MHTKKKVESYSKARKQRKNFLTTPLLRGIRDVKKLDKHIHEFMSALKKDNKYSDKELHKQIKLFEEELHAEASIMRKEILHDMNHLFQGVKKLAELKEVQEKHTGIRHPAKPVLKYEIQFAESLFHGIHTKIRSFEKLYKRLE